MLENIKKYWTSFLALASAALGVLFLLQRSKSNKLEDKLVKAEMDKKDSELVRKDENIQKNIEQIKESIKKTENAPVKVDDLEPKEVEDYWKKQ